jgi:hypothetical protein
MSEINKEIEAKKLMPEMKVLAALIVLRDGEDRNGRSRLKLPLKHGVERVFWKRGSWRVRLTTMPRDPIINVELAERRGETTLALVPARPVAAADEDSFEVDAPEVQPEMQLVPVPKFQPVVEKIDEGFRELRIAIWESADAKTREEAERAPPPKRARLGFHLMVSGMEP